MKKWLYNHINLENKWGLDDNNTIWGLILKISHSACAIAIKVVPIEIMYDYPTSRLR